jgi:hypothetical protein
MRWPGFPGWLCVAGDPSPPFTTWFARSQGLQRLLEPPRPGRQASQENGLPGHSRFVSHIVARKRGLRCVGRASWAGFALRGILVHRFQVGSLDRRAYTGWLDPRDLVGKRARRTASLGTVAFSATL